MNRDYNDLFIDIPIKLVNLNPVKLERDYIISGLMENPSSGWWCCLLVGTVVKIYAHSKQTAVTIFFNITYFKRLLNDDNHHRGQQRPAAWKTTMNYSSVTKTTTASTITTTAA